jgi:hypothetical protein
MVTTRVVEDGDVVEMVVEDVVETVKVDAMDAVVDQGLHLPIM